MEYGLIGKSLVHSYSVEIHKALGIEEYELLNVSPDEFDKFATNRYFKGINVTIPYKKDILPYCEYVSPLVKEIGSANTIVNKDDRLYAYNTDYFGFVEALKGDGGLNDEIVVKDKIVGVLGFGGVSRTVIHALVNLKASHVYVFSQRAGDAKVTNDEIFAKFLNVEAVSYEDMHATGKCEVLINATPSGMFPDIDMLPADFNDFPKVEAVCDLIYNPFRTRFLVEAKSRGIKTCGGLRMLVAQAWLAQMIFTGKITDESADIDWDEERCDKVCEKFNNYVIVGMPGCGKTTFGKKISSEQNLLFFDSDEDFEKENNISPAEYIEKYGEEKFRKEEYKIIKKYAGKSGAVIATGGGAVTYPDTRRLLRELGMVIYLTRDISELDVTGRPLSKGGAALEQLFEVRDPLYRQVCDVIL